MTDEHPQAAAFVQAAIEVAKLPVTRDTLPRARAALAVLDRAGAFDGATAYGIPEELQARALRAARTLRQSVPNRTDAEKVGARLQAVLDVGHLADDKAAARGLSDAARAMHAARAIARTLFFPHEQVPGPHPHPEVEAVSARVGVLAAALNARVTAIRRCDLKARAAALLDPR